MSARRILGTAMAAAVALSSLAGGAGAQETTLPVVSVDTSRAPDVRVVVAAPASLAGPTLDASAFRVVDGGTQAAVAVEALPADQLEVALVVDTSGSMAGAPLAGAQAAARSLLGQLPASVPVAVVGFGATPVLASPRSTNRAAELAAVDGLTARGETALYDALQTGLRQLSTDSDVGSGTQPGVRRFVVLLSDGGDTTSAATLDDTAKALADARVPLFAVELKTAERNAAALARLAGASGGQVISATDPSALGGAFDGIAKQLVRQYAVSWRSPSSGPADADVVLEASGVRAAARVRLELPAAAGVGRAQPASGEDGAARGSWALVGGAALVALALLLLFVPTAVFWTPRSRALRQSRAGRLAGAADGASAVAERVLSRLHQASAVNALLERAGLDLRPSELVAAVSIACASLGSGTAVLVGPWFGLLAAALLVLASRLLLEVLAARRRDRFADQLGDTLQMLASSLRAGYGLSQGIDVVAREAESPTADEFRRLTVELRLGRDFADALRALAARVRSEDFEWIVQSFEIHQEVGGDLAEILDNVGGTIRDRNRVRRQVRALSAEGRMSAAVLYSLPFAMVAVLAVFNPDYLRELTGSGAGQAMVSVSGALLVAGGFWLRRIVKPTF